MALLSEATLQVTAAEQRVVAPGREPLDCWLAVLVGASTAVLYLPTLFPGLGGSGDAAKFQYVGRVLGTAHQPGYPAYVLISHLFSYLPVGSLAYRMNLMSAFWAAVGAGLMYLIGLRLGWRRPVAVAVALSMAFGRYYWSYAVRAEVYTLAAALETAAVLKLLDWQARRRERDLFAAVAIAALAFGNHLTIAFAAPALVVYVLVTDAHRALRPRVLLVSIGIVLAGLAQYLFIILRTLQHAPYIEASATNLRELMQVITARHYTNQIGIFDARALFTQRLPAALSFVRVELGLFGVLLLVPGVYSLVRHRWREALLFGLAFLGTLAITLNVEADMDGFMVTVFVFAWPVVGAGVAAIASWLSACSRVVARTAPVAACALLVVPPVAGNYRPNDHHNRTWETRYFRALFEHLPDKTVIVKEAYFTDQLVLYELLGERAAGTRDIRTLPPEGIPIWDAAIGGYHVFAFETGRHALESFGFGFGPAQLADPRVAPQLAADMKVLPLYRMTLASRCEAVGNRGWVDVTPAAANTARLAVRIDDYRPFDARAIVYLAGDDMPAPTLLGTDGTGTPTFEPRSFRPADAGDARDLLAALRADGVDDAASKILAAAKAVSRLSLRVNDQGQWVSITFQGSTAITHAIVNARVDLNNPKRAMFCGQTPF